MTTLIAGRIRGQGFFHQIGRLLRSLGTVVARADRGADEASTGFSWPRGF